MTQEMGIELTDHQGESLNDVIDMQLAIISTMQEVDDSLYDDMQQDKIKVISMAIKVIMRAQKKLLQNI